MRSFNPYQRAFSGMIRPLMADSRDFVDTPSAHRLEAVFAQFQVEVRP